MDSPCRIALSVRLDSVAVDASGPCEWPIVAGKGATMAERARAGGEPEDGRAHQSLTVTHTTLACRLREPTPARPPPQL